MFALGIICHLTQVINHKEDEVQHVAAINAKEIIGWHVSQPLSPLSLYRNLERQDKIRKIFSRKSQLKTINEVVGPPHKSLFASICDRAYYETT
jgi:serine kinase of HPr protein (carbohydrate metabolism regulator)